MDNYRQRTGMYFDDAVILLIFGFIMWPLLAAIMAVFFWPVFKFINWLYF